LRTAGEPAQVRLTADRTSLQASGQDLAFITVEAVDANGQPVTVSIGGQNTLRITTDGNVNANRYLLVSPLSVVPPTSLTASANGTG